MTFETVDNILTISTDTVMTTAMAGILLLIGFWIKKKVKILDKYCIPAPVVGGFLFMFIIAVENFFLQKTTDVERLLAGVSAFCLLMPVAALDFVGIALAVIMLVLHITRYKKQPPVAQEA